MIITPLGDGTFRLQSGERSVLIDPTTNRTKSDITLYTKGLLGNVVDEPNTVALPGEYEFGGIEVRGWQRNVAGAGEKAEITTYYLVSWDDIHIAFFGPDGPLPEAGTLTELEERQPEVVLLPMKTKEQQAWAVKLVKELEPSVCIPSSYGSVKEVSGAFGKSIDKTEEKFTFKKKDLENHDQTVIVLAAK